MAGFDRQDRSRGRQVGRAHDIGRRTQIRADSHAFEDGRRRDEALGIRDGERVFACGDGGGAGFCEGGGQEGNMRHLIEGDFLEVGVEGGVETGGREVGFGKVGQTGLVEGVFEVLEGEGVVEDVSVRNGWGGLTDFLQERATAGIVLDSWSFLAKSTRLANIRLRDRAGSCDSSECCNGVCRLHGFFWWAIGDAAAAVGIS